MDGLLRPPPYTMSAKSSTKPLTAAAAIEANILANVKEATPKTVIALSPSFLSQIAKVTAYRSSYDDDNCFAVITFKNGTRSTCPLDYDLEILPKQQLVVRTLVWHRVEKSDGETIDVLYGKVAK